jgi:hypothetical protein
MSRDLTVERRDEQHRALPCDSPDTEGHRQRWASDHCTIQRG